MDLKLEIGLYIQHLQSGKEKEEDIVENLEKIQTSIQKIIVILTGGTHDR